jgi:hypothetical protein
MQAATLNIATSSSHSDLVQARSTNWSSFCERLSKVVGGVKEGRGWVAANIPDGPRTNARVISTSLIVFDIDNKGSVVTQVELERAIRAKGYRAILHSTYNDTPGNPRFRLILDISEPIKPADHKSLLLHIAQNLGITDFIDTACTDLSRYFYLPRCPIQRIKDYVFWSIEGDPVNIEACLDRIKFDRRSLEPQPSVKIESEVNAWEENESNIAKIKEFLGYCSADCEYEKWRNIIWSVTSLGWDIGLDLVRDWSKTSLRHWVRSSAQTTDEVLQGLIESFDPERDITIGTLIAESKSNGWTPISPFNQVLVVDQESVPESQLRNRSYQIYSREDLRKLPKQQWLIHGVLPLQGTAAIFGAPGTGKSFLALDLAARISEGVDQWFGIGAEQRDVVYMALEGGGGIRKRIDAWEIENSKKIENLQLVIGEFNLKDSEHVAGLMQDMKPKLNKGWVTFIDTLNQASPGSDENSSVDMGLLLAAAKQIAMESEGIVVLIHHSGKDGSKGLRGHSSMNAAMDLTIEVKKTAVGHSWSTHKVKDGDDGVTKHFTLAIHATSGSTFDEHETSCAVRPTEPPKHERTPTGKLQISVFNALKAKYEGNGPITKMDALGLAKEVLVNEPQHRVTTKAKETLASLTSGEYIKEDENNCIYLP